jgi:DNA-binding XRE family transcriptional regulator
LAKEYRKKIGRILRRYRLAAKFSQMALAEKIGISYQQLQKYEKGIDNISIYRLQNPKRLPRTSLNTASVERKKHCLSFSGRSTTKI